MSISGRFDSCKYLDGAISIDLQNSIFVVGKREIEVNQLSARIIATFIHSANEGEKGMSKRVLCQKLGLTENSLKTLMSNMRANLKGFEISPGIYASSLFLSEKIVGDLTEDEIYLGYEKKPFHFNVDLADLITQYGNNIPVNELDGVRTDFQRQITRTKTPDLFTAHIN